MAGITLSQRVEELRRDLSTLREVVLCEETSNKYINDHNLDKFALIRAAIDKLTEKIAALDNRLTSLEERTKSLEKLNDRTWQIAPMVISVVGVLISLLVAYFKK